LFTRFIVFYPETEAGGAGRTVPLSLPEEFMYSRCVCLQGREICDGIPSYRSYRCVSQLGFQCGFRRVMSRGGCRLLCSCGREGLRWCDVLIVTSVFMYFMYLAGI
jgi:hypothetical protein